MRKDFLQAAELNRNFNPNYPGYLIQYGSSGNAVLQIQRCLNNIFSAWPALAQPKLAEDGKFGKATENAVIKYQQFFVLNPDGIVGPMTWESIMNECQSVSNGEMPQQQTDYPGYLLTIGSRGNNVLQIQQWLNDLALKYPSIPKISEDGVFGNRTRNAVMAFQRLFGLSADGIVGPTTWNKIAAEVNSVPQSPGGNNNNNNNETPANGLTQDEQETLDLINQQRASNGLSPLQVDSALQEVARTKAQDMADNNYFSHNSPTYGSPFQMLNTFDIPYRTAGENIAGNSSNSGAVNDWMNSSGHRQNILNSAFGYTGLGVAEDPRYGKVYVQMFVGR